MAASLSSTSSESSPTKSAHNLLANASIFIIGLAIYSTSLDFASSGDAIYTANIIDTMSLDVLTIHQGYHVVGLLFAKLLDVTLGLTTDQSLTAMNALFGAALLVVAYNLLRHYLASQRDTLIGVLMLLVCHRVFFNATMAELYVLQTLLIWTSYLLFERHRFYASGFVLAFAMWVSPLTVFFCVWFPVVAWIRGIGISPLVRLAAAASVLYLPFLAVFINEMLWGNRGLLLVTEIKRAQPLTAAVAFVSYQFKHYSFLNLLLIPALLSLRKERDLLLMTLALLVPNLYVISKLHGEDHVFISPLDVFFIMWFIVGWRELRERSMEVIAWFALATHIAVFTISEYSLLRIRNFNYAEQIRNIGAAITQDNNAIAFGDWPGHMAMVYYNRTVPTYPLEKGAWSESVIDVARLRLLSPKELERYDRIYVIESYDPSRYATLFMSGPALERRFERVAIRRRVERFLDVKCSLQIPGPVVSLYECHRS